MTVIAPNRVAAPTDEMLRRKRTPLAPRAATSAAASRSAPSAW